MLLTRMITAQNSIVRNPYIEAMHAGDVAKLFPHLVKLVVGNGH